ncbi:hypothetical protein Droror1_Dr00014129 [Drosera rotundifolia]
MLVNKYLCDLQSYIQDVLEVLDIWDLSDAYQRAMKVEGSPERRGFAKQNLSRSIIRTSSNQPVTIESIKTKNVTTNPSKLPNTQTVSSTTQAGRCYACGEPGYRAANCHTVKNRVSGKDFS